MSYLDLVTVLRRRWKTLVLVPFAVAVATAGVSLLLPKSYTAQATFVVESASQTQSLPSGLASIAARFGVNAPAGPSPRFYADILRSRSLLNQALDSRVPDPRTPALHDSSRVIDILEIEAPSPERERELARIILDDRLGIGLDRETSVIGVSVETSYPQLSADLANLLVTLVNRFNLETRQTNARQRRIFTETRLAGVEAELLAAEGEYQRFLERNRGWEASSELRFQSERLQRRVTLLQEVVTGLRLQYEQARIEEVNDTPLVTALDAAVAPTRKSKPQRTIMVLTGGVLGGLGSLILVLWREYLDRVRTPQHVGLPRD